ADRQDRADRGDRSDGGDRADRADRSERPERQVAEVEASAPPKSATRSAPNSDDSVAATTEAEPAHGAKPIEESTATREKSELEALFPQSSIEGKQVFGEKADHVPQKTPRFMIDAGGFFGSRSLIWDADPDANVQQFAGVTTKGLQVSAAVYPWPLKQTDGAISGIGFTGSMHPSAGSTGGVDHIDTPAGYARTQNAWGSGRHNSTADTSRA